MRKLLFFFLFCAAGFGNAQNSKKNLSAEGFQQKLNNEFKDPESSPLPPQDFQDFSFLDFFRIDTTFQVVADFERTPFEVPFEMPTTTDRKPVYIQYGILHFNLKGKDLKLNVYQNQDPKPGYEDYLFIPFTDLTNGKTTYAGGRYLDLIIPLPDEVILDFNKAYNPYCAYNGKYSCPIVPAENHLDLEIPVGVKAYEK